MFMGGKTKGLHDTPAWRALKRDCNRASGSEFLCLPGLEIVCDAYDMGGLDSMHYLAYDLNLAIGVRPHPIFGIICPRSPDFHHYYYNDETIFDFVSDPKNKGFGNKGWGIIAHPQYPLTGVFSC